MRIAHSSILTAFATETIGTKVTNPTRFMEVLKAAVAAHDPSTDRQTGQHFIMLPSEVLETVSAGVGRTTKNPEDYVVRMHRGQASLFLKRTCAAPAESCAAIVYTREAYLADPDVMRTPEKFHHISERDCTHVLVAVLAFAGPKAPVGYERFVKNLAGGNNEALALTGDEIRARAVEVVAYWDAWQVVAD